MLLVKRSLKIYKKASFVLFSEVMHQSENFLQKGDVSFRDSRLVFPILDLVLQAIGKKIANYYQLVRNANIDEFYAGNYDYMCMKYKQIMTSFTS